MALFVLCANEHLGGVWLHGEQRRGRVEPVARPRERAVGIAIDERLKRSLRRGGEANDLAQRKEMVGRSLRRGSEDGA